MTKKLTITLLFVLLLTGCFHSETEDKGKMAVQEKQEVKVITDGEYFVDVSNSRIQWTGSRVLYSHFGTIGVYNGSFLFNDGVLTGGSFEFDMQSISDEDIEDQKRNEGLINHLKSADFFDVENYPTAALNITDSNPVGTEGEYLIIAELTIKDTTNEIEFPAFVKRSDSNASIDFESDFSIDRTLWDIKFGSGKFFEDLGNQLIKDKIDFSVQIKADYNK